MDDVTAVEKLDIFLGTVMHSGKRVVAAGMALRRDIPAILLVLIKYKPHLLEKERKRSHPRTQCWTCFFIGV